MFEYTVDVGATTSRPVIPDEHISRCVVLADNDNDARNVALAMVMGRRDVVMPTSANIVAVVL